MGYKGRVGGSSQGSMACCFFILGNKALEGRGKLWFENQNKEVVIGTIGLWALGEGSVAGISPLL